jgi:hypothetical protein
MGIRGSVLKSRIVYQVARATLPVILDPALPDVVEYDDHGLVARATLPLTS